MKGMLKGRLSDAGPGLEGSRAGSRRGNVNP